MKNTKLIIGLWIVGAIVAIAVIGPFLVTHSPNEIRLEERFLAPSSTHWFGTDHNGSDILSIMVSGARVSVMISIFVVSLNVLLGLLIGSAAGFWGGIADLVVMRFVDMVFGFPGFLLVLAVAAVMQQSSVLSVVFALCVTGWASYSRLVRGEILHLKEREFVLAAHSMGFSQSRILFGHIWPNLTAPLLIQSSFNMASTIITESSLSFLGLGVPPSTPSWGSLLGAGRQFLIEAPQMSVFPGLGIVILVLGFNLLGDGLRETLDTRGRN
ncbi:MAG: ABC transporter permease [Bdellovibrionaceae bacterium]|nr:ABC transporter permease [Pseudobdellovibrionaceae bacterium]